jgi:hypothetical protein
VANTSERQHTCIEMIDVNRTRYAIHRGVDFAFQLRRRRHLVATDRHICKGLERPAPSMALDPTSL